MTERQNSIAESLRGIRVLKNQSARRMEGLDRAGRQVEIDVLLVNGDAIVAVAVKTKCKVEDIDGYLVKLSRFREAFRQYSGHRLLAGIAAVTFDSDCDRYAYKRGMFVLKPVAGIVQIQNDDRFVPTEFLRCHWLAIHSFGMMAKAGDSGCRILR